jgi:hypothetical protein
MKYWVPYRVAEDPELIDPSFDDADTGSSSR